MKPSIMLPKPCITCRYCQKGARYLRCTRPSRELEVDRVQGVAKIRSPIDCYTERSVSWLEAIYWNLCGQRGRFWKPKHKEQA